jgi:hypothetical protein
MIHQVLPAFTADLKEHPWFVAMSSLYLSTYWADPRIRRDCVFDLCTT